MNGLGMVSLAPRNAGAPPKRGTEQRLDRERLVKRRDRVPSLFERRGTTPSPRVDGLHDRFEKPCSAIPPSRGVQRGRELGQAPFVHFAQCHDQRIEIGFLAQPPAEGRLDRRPQPTTTMAEQRAQQLIAIAEVVIDPGVGHAYPGRDGPYVDRRPPPLGQQRLGSFEYLLLRLIWAPAAARHEPSIP